MPLRPPPFTIVDETAEYVVVDKAPGLQAHPSKPSDERTLWHFLRDLLGYELACGGQISLINRLDRETSGLTLVAKTREAARHFGLQMLRREIRKGYLALVTGLPTAETWEVQAPLRRQGEFTFSRIYLKQAIHPEGAPAHTRFRVRQRLAAEEGGAGKYTLVEAEPLTGRMHQIRVHLAHSGHPVVGDKIYGPDEGNYLEFIETSWTPALAARLHLPCHALHSAMLGVAEGTQWHAPAPAQWSGFLGGLRQVGDGTSCIRRAD